MVDRHTETLGQAPADTLTKCLVLDGTDQLATKDDLKAGLARQTLLLMIPHAAMLVAVAAVLVTLLTS